MTLDTEKEIEQTWGSHKPFLAGVLDVLYPRKVVECGCGNYSTPIIEHYAESIVTIEHDRNWANQIIRKYADHDEHYWEVETFPKVHNGVRREDVAPETLKKIDAYYASLEIDNHDFLFVDTFTCARVPAILNLSKRTKMMMIHDWEDTSPWHYNYELIEDAIRGWYRYRFAPPGVIAQSHKIPWTDLFTRFSIDGQMERLQEVVDYHAKILWGFSTKIVDITSKGMKQND